MLIPEPSCSSNILGQNANSRNCSRNPSPFAHDVDPCGTYTTDLDQFPGKSSILHLQRRYLKLSTGNSGGPVFDGLTGEVVGHTVSTQSAVSESSVTDIETWETEYLINSHNYKDAFETINPYLARKHSRDPTYRVHPKFHRTLSGNPGGGALFLNTTFVCPGDIGPNGIPQRPDTYQACFNRHHWDSLDVVFRNLTGRIDRIYLFTRPLALIVAECTRRLLSCWLLDGVYFLDKVWGHFQFLKWYLLINALNQLLHSPKLTLHPIILQ